YDLSQFKSTAIVYLKVTQSQGGTADKTVALIPANTYFSTNFSSGAYRGKLAAYIGYYNASKYADLEREFTLLNSAGKIFYDIKLEKLISISFYDYKNKFHKQYFRFSNGDQIELKSSEAEKLNKLLQEKLEHEQQRYFTQLSIQDIIKVLVN
ncbi:MAG: hypothetical protein ABIQ95_07380, partial [Bdellovibrionia bacterium]